MILSQKQPKTLEHFALENTESVRILKNLGIIYSVEWLDLKSSDEIKFIVKYKVLI